jgi:hypothetical protein
VEEGERDGGRVFGEEGSEVDVEGVARVVGYAGFEGRERIDVGLFFAPEVSTINNGLDK